VLMGADYYETDEQLAANLALGRPHLGVRQELPREGRHHRQERPHWRTGVCWMRRARSMAANVNGRRSSSGTACWSCPRARCFHRETVV